MSTTSSISVPGCTVKVCTILDTEKTSDSVDLEAFSRVSLWVPITNGTPNLTFEGSHDDVSFAAMVEDDGSTVVVTIAAGAAAIVIGSEELEQLRAARFVRIVSSVTQTSDRVFYWILAA